MTYKPKNRLSKEEYINGVLSGNRMLLSRSITIIESNLEIDRVIAKDIIQTILPHSGKSLRIGITGVPGVGKSTFIESFGKYLVSKGKKVAVLSVDPSSQISKGSILGDKTRMEELSNLKGAFIRPSASGSTLGGVANKTSETILLCEAAGYDVILVETVGVGQSETVVKSMTDFFLLLMLSGAGDELQGIKKGIMEMADMLVINKADGDNIKKSQMARLQYANALHMFPPSESGWTPVVDTCSAVKETGIDNVWNKIIEYKSLVDNNNFFEENRKNQLVEWMLNNINDELKSMFYKTEGIKEKLSVMEDDVISLKTSPIMASKEMLDYFTSKFSS